VCNSSADGDIMTCLTADLSSLSNLTDVDWPVLVTVSFVMDAVGGLATGRNPLVRYYDDPVVHQFDGYDNVQYFYDDDTDLEIRVCFFHIYLILLYTVGLKD